MQKNVARSKQNTGAIRIAFVWSPEELEQIPASRLLGCLVEPKEACPEAGATARSTLAVEDVDAVVKAMAAHACL